MAPNPQPRRVPQHPPPSPGPLSLAGWLPEEVRSGARFARPGEHVPDVQSLGANLRAVRQEFYFWTDPNGKRVGWDVTAAEAAVAHLRASKPEMLARITSEVNPVQFKREVIDKNPSSVDPAYAMRRPLGDPVLGVDYTFVHEGVEATGVVQINGAHRLYRAAAEGLTAYPIVVLPEKAGAMFRLHEIALAALWPKEGM